MISASRYSQTPSGQNLLASVKAHSRLSAIRFQYYWYFTDRPTKMALAKRFLRTKQMLILITSCIFFFGTVWWVDTIVSLLWPPINLIDLMLWKCGVFFQAHFCLHWVCICMIDVFIYVGLEVILIYIQYQYSTTSITPSRKSPEDHIKIFPIVRIS